MKLDKITHCMLPVRRATPWLYVVRWLLALFLLAACSQPPSPTGNTPPTKINLITDGRSLTLTTEAANVRELLEETGITLGDLDEVTPPLFTLLENDLTVQVVRVREEIEIIPQSIPFERQIVRSESLEADDPPVILQAGKTGLQEVTVRIVYRDDLEAERWPVQTTMIEPAQHEIVMVGIGAASGNVSFAGLLAYINAGSAVLLRGQSAFPEQIETGEALDGRIFSLSPTGSHLLYSRTINNSTTFQNSLWLVGTERGAQPRPLGINNVLWAGWNPAQTEGLQIAYSTAISTSSPPGWEANNDLWLLEIPLDTAGELEPVQLVEAYPATYGWWGGNYAWSPDGRFMAYSFASEVGVLDLNSKEEDNRRLLQQFTEFDTNASWVWLPTLSWSPDGRFLAFTNHNSNDTEAQIFDTWVADAVTGTLGRFVAQTGMWGHVHWGRDGAVENGRIAFLQTTDPLDSLRSSYTLWLMDADGSNARQIYPPAGEISYFPHEQQFMAWGPTGLDISFVFNNGLYLFDLNTLEARRLTQEDATISHPTWAPYGQATLTDLTNTQLSPLPTPVPDNSNELLPEEES